MTYAKFCSFALMIFLCSSELVAQQLPPASPSQQGDYVTSERFSKLEERTKETAGQINAAIWGAGIFAFLVGALSIFNLVTSTARESAVRQMLELIRSGEVAAQKRADELHNVVLDEGKTTLGLVNDTLRLARDATEGAVHALERKVHVQLSDVNTKINTFLVDFSNRDSHDIVNKRNNKDTLKTLIYELAAFESSNAVLAKPVELTPSCEFIKALQYYLDDHYDLTIKHLQKLVAKLQDGTARLQYGTDLLIRCWYWIGYEQNNIGEFDKAQESFTTAISMAFGERRLMLERLRVETMLFNARHKATDLIDNIDRVISACEVADCSEDSKELLALTKSNVLYAAAMEVYRDGQGDRASATQYMEQVLSTLKPLVDKTSPNPNAEREYAFASIAIQRNVDFARALLDSSVRNHARQEVANRPDARHKAFNNAVLLMLAKELRQEDYARSLDLRSTQFVGDVHEGLRLYSPIRKRNITKNEFMDDVRSIMSHGVPPIV